MPKKQKLYSSVSAMLKDMADPDIFNNMWVPEKLKYANNTVLKAIEIIMDLDPEPKSFAGIYLKKLSDVVGFYEKTKFGSKQKVK